MESTTQKKHYLALQSIQPNKNKFRKYIIEINEEESGFEVHLKRGRISRKPREKVMKFQSKSQMYDELEKILDARNENGYKIANMSMLFPYLRVMDKLKK